MKFFLLKFSLFSLAINISGAAQIHLEGRNKNPPGLHRRTVLAGTTDLTDQGDILYFTDITLGSPPTTISVNIDTGSSDLWVITNISNSIDTGVIASVAYGQGEAIGPVNLATLEFAGYTIPNQAYIHAMNNDTPPVPGLIGLGPQSGSEIRSFLGNVSAGDSPLDRIFRQNTSTPNFISVLLGRADDPENLYPGDLTVGEILLGFDSILDQPQLPVTVVASSESANQHFQVLLDEDGIIGPDGQVIPLTTAVDSTSDKRQATVVFDSGFTFPQVPRAVSDAIYSRVPNATFNQDFGVWILPCEQELNLTFKFAGVAFPIHPLDINQNFTLDNGTSGCIGAALIFVAHDQFQPMTFDTSTLEGGAPTFDMILGMSFLRNAYLLVNFGDFVDGSTNMTADPYIQLLPLNNDPRVLHGDFIEARGGNITFSLLDTPILESSNNGDNSTSTGKSDASLSEDLARISDKGRRRSLRLVYIIIGAVASIFLLFIAGLCFFCRRRGRKNRGAPGIWDKHSKYRPLHRPEPIIM